MTVFTLAADPIQHVLNRPVFGIPHLMHVVTLVLALLLTVFVVNKAAQAIATGPDSEGNERYITKGHPWQMLEVVILYLRDKVIRPQLGEDTNAFLPYLLTLFFFILFNNLLGLVPLLDLQHLIGSFFGDSHFAVIGGTATGNIAVTSGLAVIAFIVINVSGIRSAGLGGWLKHLTGGAPMYIWPIMIPVELMGMFIKPAALALRLFANMTAGHVLLAVLLGFTAAGLKAGLLVGAGVGVVALLGSVAIMFLEIFVAFLQAFIFMFLTCLFIAQLRHHHHDDHAHAEEYGTHGHAMVTDKAAPVSAV